MKRVIAVVGVVLGLGAIGLTTAHAGNQGPSTWCTNGDGASETDVPNPAVGLSFDHWRNWNGWELYTVCWSTTPTGSGAPEAAGGAVRAGFRQNNQWEETVGVWCFGDRTADTMATVECENYVWTTDDFDLTTMGRSVSASSKVGTAGPVGVSRTGVDIASPTLGYSTSTGRPGASAGLGSGTCVYANGSTPHGALCPGGTPVASGYVATGDASIGAPTQPGSCVTVGGNPCAATAPAGIGVSVGRGDPSNDTVDATVAGTPVRQDAGMCPVGYNAPPSC